MSILSEIVARRRQDIRTAKARRSAGELGQAAAVRVHRSLIEHLRARTAAPAIIAEIKRASPSAGSIRPDLSPAQLARDYHQAGAAAISILTEPHYFQGTEADVPSVRNAVPLPLLRKDFIVDEYQVLETAAIGADLLLLIVAALDRSLMKDLTQAADACGLEVLVEVHDENELDLALDQEQTLIGVNSRNLKTMVTDLDVARRMIKTIPDNRIAVAESGIRNATEIRDLHRLGYRAFLVGESLLKQGQPGDNLRALLEASPLPPPPPEKD